jgi:hypothetical protein
VTASTGPVGGASRYCQYRSASSRSGPAISLSPVSTAPRPSARAHHSVSQSSEYSSASMVTRGFSATFRSRLRLVPDFGFWSTAVYTVSPSTAKVTTATCGRPSASAVPSRTTRTPANRARASFSASLTLSILPLKTIHQAGPVLIRSGRDDVILRPADPFRLVVHRRVYPKVRATLGHVSNRHEIDLMRLGAVDPKVVLAFSNIPYRYWIPHDSIIAGNKQKTGISRWH